MDILKAKQIALAAWPLNMDAKFFFITNDEKAFTNPTDAVAHAVKLSAGNPEVETVNVEELELPEGFEAPVITNETVTNNRIEAMNALENKINHLAAEIIKLDNKDEINDENMAAKMHVANLKKQLKDAANAYIEFDPTCIGPFNATVLNLVGQLLHDTVIETLVDAINAVAPVTEEIIAPVTEEITSPVTEEIIAPVTEEIIAPAEKPKGKNANSGNSKK